MYNFSPGLLYGVAEEMSVAKTLFIVSKAVLIYVYIGYPFLCLLLSRLKRNKYKTDDIIPSVTIIIAAYNEENCIAETVQNKLELDYPSDKLEIIVVSDASSDNTDALVAGIAEQDSRVIFLRQQNRRGKTAALNTAAEVATGKIIVFSDANSIYNQSTLLNLVKPFADSSVGYVTGKMVYNVTKKSASGDGCSSYMKYENRLREIESNFGSVVGVDGGIDAVRKQLYTAMPEDMQPDFGLPLSVIENGRRVVFTPFALVSESTLGNSSEEFSMRVRVILRALWAIRSFKHLLNPFKYGLFSWQLFSHKILRYLAPLFLLGCLISSLFMLNDGTWWAIWFPVQVAFYLLAFAGSRMEKAVSPLITFPLYFTLVNIASAVALVSFLKGKKMVTWKPRT
jgi:cellulose synthase/poly-beta-1,6-N-acetylglucosamine synthase-like glycosyltransferase